MAAHVALHVRPITTPHLDLDHLPLADRDFQIKDKSTQNLLLKIHCSSRDKYLNHTDDISLWESNFPEYQFPEVHVFPEIVHQCHACYIPSLRAIMSPDQKILFTITDDSINEMLQIQLGHNLIPLSIGDLLDQYSKLSLSKLAQIFQTFIVEERYIPEDPPPYVSAMFFERGKQIITMISCVLGYSTDEFVDELVLAFMSIYTLGQPPVVLYNYAKFIAEIMHEQFTRMQNERVFKY